MPSLNKLERERAQKIKNQTKSARILEKRKQIKDRKNQPNGRTKAILETKGTGTEQVGDRCLKPGDQVCSNEVQHKHHKHDC